MKTSMAHHPSTEDHDEGWGSSAQRLNLLCLPTQEMGSGQQIQTGLHEGLRQWQMGLAGTELLDGRARRQGGIRNCLTGFDFEAIQGLNRG